MSRARRPPALLATAEASVLAQAGLPPERPGAPLAAGRPRLPVRAVRAGPVRRRRHPGRHAHHGRRPAACAEPATRSPSSTTSGWATLGRAARRSSPRSTRPPRSPAAASRSSTSARSRSRGWTIQFVLLTMLLPFLAATVDLFARARRRHVTLLPALRSLRSRLGVWLWAGAIFAFFSLVGILPDRRGPADRADSPTSVTSWPCHARLVVLGVPRLHRLAGRPARRRGRRVDGADELAGTSPRCSGWPWSRSSSRPRTPSRSSSSSRRCTPGCGCRSSPIARAVSPGGLRGWIRRPAPPPRSFATRYELGVDTLWYLPALVSVGYVPLPLLLATLGWGAVAAQIGALALGRYAPYPAPDERPVRGPIRETIGRIVLAFRGRGRAPQSRRGGRRARATPVGRPLGGFGETPLVVGVRWSFRGKDAGSADSGAIGATEDAASGRAARLRTAQLYYVKPSY